MDTVTFLSPISKLQHLRGPSTISQLLRLLVTCDRSTVRNLRCDFQAPLVMNTGISEFMRKIRTGMITGAETSTSSNSKSEPYPKLPKSGLLALLHGTQVVILLIRVLGG